MSKSTNISLDRVETIFVVMGFLLLCLIPYSFLAKVKVDGNHMTSSLHNCWISSPKSALTVVVNDDVNVCLKGAVDSVSE